MPEAGERRVIEKFLILPRCIEGRWKWLQHASYEEEYGFLSVDDVFTGRETEVLGWSMKRWLETFTAGDSVVYNEYSPEGKEKAEGTYRGQSEANPAFHYIEHADGETVRLRMQSDFTRK